VNWMHLAQGREPMAGSYEHVNKPSDSIKGEFLD
jgi:hypothetical protein